MSKKRTTQDIAPELVACYEWNPISEPPPNDPDGFLCVSVPSDMKFPHQVAIYEDGKFKNVAGEFIGGVTYWCHLPPSPEQMKADDEAEQAELALKK